MSEWALTLAIVAQMSVLSWIAKAGFDRMDKMTDCITTLGETLALRLDVCEKRLDEAGL